MQPNAANQAYASTPGMTCPRRAAFTLVEMLVVIGIIAVLVAMAVVVGTKVVEGGKSRATQNVVRVLDESLGAWTMNADSPLPSYTTVAFSATQDLRFPLLDGRPKNAAFDAPAYSGLTNYTAMAMNDASIRAVFEQLDTAFVSPAAVPGWRTSSQQYETWAEPAVEIKDAWGRAMRIVHPAYHGGHGDFWDDENDRLETRDVLQRLSIPGAGGQIQIVDFRRSYRPFADNASRQTSWVGDADEGMCVGGTPYFYSAGEDGDPGARRDNVYSTVPRFPVETRDFQ